MIGAGTMGNGIAQVCALAGVDVVMLDITEATLERGVIRRSGRTLSPAAQQLYQLVRLALPRRVL